jgi:hypothetical protein
VSAPIAIGRLKEQIIGEVSVPIAIGRLKEQIIGEVSVPIAIGRLKEQIIGEVSEWLKEHAWKVCIGLKLIAGSNPALSAKKVIILMTFFSLNSTILFFQHFVKKLLTRYFF